MNNNKADESEMACTGALTHLIVSHKISRDDLTL